MKLLPVETSRYTDLIGRDTPIFHSCEVINPKTLCYEETAIRKAVMSSFEVMSKAQCARDTVNSVKAYVQEGLSAIKTCLATLRAIDKTIVDTIGPMLSAHGEFRKLAGDDAVKGVIEGTPITYYPIDAKNVSSPFQACTNLRNWAMTGDVGQIKDLASTALRCAIVDGRITPTTSDPVWNVHHDLQKETHYGELITAVEELVFRTTDHMNLADVEEKKIKDATGSFLNNLKLRLDDLSRNSFTEKTVTDLNTYLTDFSSETFAVVYATKILKDLAWSAYSSCYSVHQAEVNYINQK